MQEDAIANELASLSNVQQTAYLTAAVQHVCKGLDDFDYSEEPGGSEIVDAVSRALDLAWSAVEGKPTSETQAISETLDELVDEDTDTALAHITSAVELLVTSFESPNSEVVRILNNLEAVLDVWDEEEEASREERAWQTELLAFVSKEKPKTRAAFAELLNR